MPIRPENKARYPKEWPEISLTIRRRAGWRCEECRVPDGAYGWRDEAGRFYRVNKRKVRQDGRRFYVMRPDPDGLGEVRLYVIKIVLTVAHLDHMPENCEATNLRAWCQRCHNRYDAQMRRDGIAERRAAAHRAAGDLFEGLDE